MNRLSKYILFIVFAILLLFPAIQTFKVLRLKSLDGAYELTKPPQFTLQSWFSGEFQETFTKSIEDHIGFRNWFICLRNEIDYTLFSIVHTFNIVVGKDEVLYQEVYLSAYNGDDYVGDDIVKRKLDKFQFVQNELQKRGIFLMLLIAPGKASIYPEYIPETWSKKHKTKTNYDAYTQELQNRSINYLDMRKYLSQIKDTIKHPLFPKCGTHWSGYTITIVADTLIKYLEQKTKFSLTHFNSTKGYETNSDFRFTDNDIGNAMNLMWNIKAWKVYYPTITFEKKNNTSKPDILTIGDSFNQSFWGFYPFFSTIFGSNSQYWYYNRVISWPDSLAPKSISTERLDYKKEIEIRKIIMIVTTEQNLNDFGFSFIDQAYNIYNPSVHYEEKIAEYISKVHTDSNLHKIIKEKALMKNINNIDLMAFMDAKWLINDAEQKKDAVLHQMYLDSIKKTKVNYVKLK